MRSFNHDDFDKHFDRMTWLMYFWFFICAVCAIAMVGVGIWAVIALVSHFT